MLSRRIRKNTFPVRTSPDTYEIDRKGRDSADQPTQPPAQEPQAVDVDNNDCKQGSVIGGLFGAGLGAALSRKEGRWVGVPVGAAAGALVGCQVDGG